MLEYYLKYNNLFAKCPKCGNNTIFKAFSQQVSEDHYEVWVECNCGYDPTAGKIGHRFEDSFGGVHEDNVLIALECWNDAINEKST